MPGNETEAYVLESIGFQHIQTYGYSLGLRLSPKKNGSIGESLVTIVRKAVISVFCCVLTNNIIAKSFVSVNSRRQNYFGSFV